MRRLADTQLTGDECTALFGEFLMDNGTCRCRKHDTCPICNDDKLDEWLRKRRMVTLGLRVINGGR